MKKLSVMVGAALALTPAFASSASGETVGYQDAIECSAVYTFLGASVEGEPEEEVLLDIATRWLVLAMARDGTEDGSRAETELEPLVGVLIEEIERLGDDEVQIDQVLTDKTNYCDAIQQEVAEEFDSVGTE